MRTLLYGAAASLDGYIARPDGAVDWLLWSKDVAGITSTYWATVDTVVMGRKIYEVVGAPAVSPYPGKMTYVYSRTLTPRRDEGLEIGADDAVERNRCFRYG